MKKPILCLHCSSAITKSNPVLKCVTCGKSGCQMCMNVVEDVPLECFECIANSVAEGKDDLADFDDNDDCVFGGDDDITGEGESVEDEDEEDLDD